MLEATVARAATGRHYEILVEHLLLSMLEPEAGDCARILAHFGQERIRLAARVEQALGKMHTGNAARPVFSENLFQWIEDAWIVASVEHGASRLRSGQLLVELILKPGRYTAESFPELEAIDADELRRTLDEILGPSPETIETGPEPGAGGPVGAGGVPAARGEEALKRFTTSFTEKARKGEIDPVFGRHREIRQVVDILSRRRKNNPILVGEPGTGKTAIVEGLALAMIAGDVPDNLKNTEIMGLDLGALQAGAAVKGEFENRMKAVIAEVKGSPRPVILFIDEAHTIIGAGGPAGGSDAANLLKPALARGELRTIAATTWSEYKKYFEKDAALERRFQPVKVEEPSEDDAVMMLRGLRPTYEKAHGVTIRDEAIDAAVRISHRYLTGRQLPDKAVDLLDTAAGRVKVEINTKPEEVVALESDLSGLVRHQAALVRDRADGCTIDEEVLKETEDQIAAIKDKLVSVNARWEEERAATLALIEARKQLSGAGTEGPVVEAARGAVKDALARIAKVRGEETLVHSEVDADVIARVVAGWTGIPVGKMKTDAISSALDLETRLRERVRGQEAAVSTVAETIRIAYAGLRNPNTPIGVLLFVGPSGVGKTETALALADVLYGGERFMTTINMSEYQEKHTVSRLIGSPPGYVGYGQGGILTEAVRQRPYSVVLLDECEKADLEVMNLFYQVFDKGSLADGEGRPTDFKNVIMILTSNLASDTIMKLFEAEEPPTTEAVSSAIRPALNKHFKPALLARMRVVPFGPLPPPILREIAAMKLKQITDRLMDSHGIRATFAQDLVDELARRCTDSETGARNVDHILRGSLMPSISRDLLERLAGETPPTSLEVGLSPDGGWRVDFFD